MSVDARAGYHHDRYPSEFVSTNIMMQLVGREGIS